MRFGHLIPSEPLWPNTLLTRRKDTIRIDSVFDRLDEPSVCMIVKVVQRSDTICVAVSDSSEKKT